MGLVKTRVTTNSFQSPHRPPILMMMNSTLKNMSTSWKYQGAVAWSIAISGCNCQVYKCSFPFTAWSRNNRSFVNTLKNVCKTKQRLPSNGSRGCRDCHCSLTNASLRERLYFALHMVKLPLLASRKENLVEPTFVFETNAWAYYRVTLHHWHWWNEKPNWNWYLLFVACTSSQNHHVISLSIFAHFN